VQDKLYEELAADIEQANCTYQVVAGNVPSVPSVGQLVRRNKRLYFVAPDLRPGSRIHVKIQTPAGTWTSDQEDVNTDVIPLSFKAAPRLSDQSVLQALQQFVAQRDNATVQRFDEFRNLRPSQDLRLQQ
jgi:hypothetical protein